MAIMKNFSFAGALLGVLVVIGAFGISASGAHAYYNNSIYNTNAGYNSNNSIYNTSGYYNTNTGYNYGNSIYNTSGYYNNYYGYGNYYGGNGVNASVSLYPSYYGNSGVQGNVGLSYYGRRSSFSLYFGF